MSKSLSYFVLTIFAAFIAYLIQSNMFLCGDVSYLLHATKSLFSGGKYGQDFFETNPPMILYLYSPVVFIAKWFSLDILRVMVVYILLAGIFSCLLSYYFIAKITAQNPLTRFLLFLSLLLSVFYLPANQFGQREHFFLMLFLPYLFSAVSVVDHQKTPGFLACVVGVLLLLGVGLKPYFLFPVICVETYLMMATRRFFVWVRPEMLVFGFGMIVYLVSVWLLQPSYVHLILPLVSKFYFMGIQQTWISIFSLLTVIYCLLVLVFYLVFSYQKKWTPLVHVLFSALIGAMLSFIVPRAPWYYHVIPALGLAMMLASVCISYLLSDVMTSKRDGVFVGMANFLVIFVPLLYAYSLTKYEIQISRKSDMVDVMAYVNTLEKNASLYCFSGNTTRDCFPLVDMTRKLYGGRVPFFWWMRGILMREKHQLLTPQDKNYFIDIVTTDLNQYQPSIVLMNTADKDEVFGKQFDFVRYFSENKNFREAWSHYRYAKQFGSYVVFKRDTLAKKAKRSFLTNGTG